MNEENHVDSNCFVLTIICHGNDKGHLLDVNQTKAWDTELFVGDLNLVKILVGKPKIILIQACGGSEYDVQLLQTTVLIKLQIRKFAIFLLYKLGI